MAIVVSMCRKAIAKSNQSLHAFLSLKIHPKPALKLNKVDIPVVTEYTFLGVIFDSKL